MSALGLVSDCRACDFSRRVGSAGLNCGTHEALLVLAHNLSIGAALYRAYRDGVRDGYTRSPL